MTIGTTPHTYRRWFEYERDAHAAVVTSLEAVPAELQESDGFRKAVALLAHIATARKLWLHRFGVTDRGPSSLFPDVDSLEDATALLDEAHLEFGAFLRNITSSEIGREFEYTALDGSQFTNTVEDILTQLFGHSLYHRGQIALLLRTIGCEPAITDFVFWTRKPVENK